MSNIKAINTIDKSNIIELTEELYNRKRRLVSINIHTTLKQDPVVMKEAKNIKKECQKIAMFINTIEKAQKANISLEKKKANEALENSNKKTNKKVK